MSVTSGFFNSVSGDRKYNAEEFSSIFDGVITDGVFRATGNSFQTLANGGMQIRVKSGRAWFNHTWTLNSDDLILAVEESDLISPRIDALVIEVNNGDSVRANSIKILKGTPGTNPQAPAMARDVNNKIWQYPLYYIYVANGVQQITDANITDARGTGLCPWVTVVTGDFTTYAYISQDGKTIHIGNRAITPLDASYAYIDDSDNIHIGNKVVLDYKDYAYIDGSDIHIGDQVYNVTNYAYIGANGEIHIGNKVVTPLTSDYAYISNGVVYIGNKQVRPLQCSATNEISAKARANTTAVTTLSDSQLRNIHAGTSEMTSGSTALTTGDIYVQYE